MQEFAYVRLDRPEAGEKNLPAKDRRRCRYYVRAETRKEALAIIAERRPGERTEIVGSREVPLFSFELEEKEKPAKDTKAVKGPKNKSK